MDRTDELLSSTLQTLQQLESSSSGANLPNLAQRQYEYAQLLNSVGKQAEAVPYFQKAIAALKEYRGGEVYSTLYYSMVSQFAIVLDYLGQIPQCESVFEELNGLRPEGWHLGDYAFFLHRRKRDYDRAEQYYKKCLSQFPNHSSVLVKYAGFLRHVRKDLVSAEAFYKRAVDSNPMNADALGSYASFLHGVLQRIDEAAIFYAQAVAVDDTHANNLCNYGLFLSEERQEFAEAERHYRRVLEVHAKHTNTLYNYAVLLDSHLLRKDEAERLYRAAIELEPKHAYALYNLAVLLEEAHLSAGTEVSDAQRQEVCSFYRRAVEADARDANTLADFGRFQYLRMGDVSQAESLLQAALKLDDRCESALYHLALLMHRECKQLDGALQLIQKLLDSQPEHRNGVLLLAHILVDRVRMPSLSTNEREDAVEKAVKAFDKAVMAHRDTPSVAAEYLRMVQALGTSKMKLAAIRTVAEALQLKSDKEVDVSRRASIADCQSLIDQLKASISV